MPIRQNIFHDVENIRAHEGLAARNADLDGLVDLVKELPHIRSAEINQSVIAG